MLDISAVMLTHNSDAYLEHTLAPLIESCSEIVVLDMESNDKTLDICHRYLRKGDPIVNYKREYLFEFGFGHARNHAARFASREWIFAIDSDELIDAHELVEAFSNHPLTASVLDVERRNYDRLNDLDLRLTHRIIDHATYSTERHRRLYRRDPMIRFEGIVHEEVWEGASSAFTTCAPLNITLHHLSSYGPSDGDKHGLYAYLLMKAHLYPSFRHGTNEWFFNHFVPQHMDALIDGANHFAAQNGLRRLSV